MRHHEHHRASRLFIGVAAIALVAPSVARAQLWPADDEWIVLYCGGEPSSDPRRDEPSAVGERDVVGSASAPALYFFADGEYAFFRMRVDAEPATGTDFNSFGWAVEIDTDGWRATYELLGEVDGSASPDEVVLARNTVLELPDDPADPAEVTLVRYEGATHARAVAAPSTFGGDPDFFVDWAMPLDDLFAEGVTPRTALVFAMGTSSSTRRIDADLACHDPAGGPRRLRFGTTHAVRIDGEPVPDRDGDGYYDDEEQRAGSDPDDPNSIPQDGSGPGGGLAIRGGPAGCVVHAGAGGANVALFATALVFGLTVLRRRRR